MAADEQRQGEEHGIATVTTPIQGVPCPSARRRRSGRQSRATTLHTPIDYRRDLDGSCTTSGPSNSATAGSSRSTACA